MDQVISGLRKLLASYTEPCTGDCDHSQCPLLRQLHALQIKATLEQARLTAKPIVDHEKRGEEIGDLMNMRLHAATPVAAPEGEQSQPWKCKTCGAALDCCNPSDDCPSCRAKPERYMEMLCPTCGQHYMSKERITTIGLWVIRWTCPEGHEFDIRPLYQSTAATAQPSEVARQIAEEIRDWLGISGLVDGQGINEVAAIISRHLRSAPSWQYTHERDAELIRKDGMMCEAHPGLEFGHDPSCGGPGMAWTVEGRSAIEHLRTAAVPETELVDEVQRRMDQLVEAAVEWHQAGREGAEWFEAAERLGAAIDSLLELRSAPVATAVTEE